MRSQARLIAAVPKKVELDGITHAELANKTGVPRSAVTGILSGRLQRVTIDRLLKKLENKPNGTPFLSKGKLLESFNVGRQGELLLGVGSGNFRRGTAHLNVYVLGPNGEKAEKAKYHYTLNGSTELVAGSFDINAGLTLRGSGVAILGSANNEMPAVPFLVNGNQLILTDYTADTDLEKIGQEGLGINEVHRLPDPQHFPLEMYLFTGNRGEANATVE